MNRLILFTLLLAAAAAPAPLTAQGAPPAAPPTATVRGSVVDAETGRPLASAAISLWSARDTALVSGALTRPNGSFQIDGVRPGEYFVRVEMLGYATHRSAGVAVRPEGGRTDLGALALTPAAVAVEGVMAAAERSSVVLAPDRQIYNVASLPGAAGGNAADVLRNVPALEVDIDGRPSLRGNTNVAVQINGRPTPMRGEQLGQYLQQLPSAMIDRVEVIPNPSAREDAEGLAGIVNIVMKQNVDLGTSGGLVLGAGTTDRLMASGNLGYQGGPLTVLGTYGFFTDTREFSSHSLRQNHFAGAPAFLEQDGTGAQTPHSHTVTSTAEYRLSARDVLSSSLMATTRGFALSQDNVFTEQDQQRAPVGSTQRLTATDLADRTVDASLTFRRTWEARRHELSVEGRGVRSAGGYDNDFTTHDLDHAEPSLVAPLARDRSDVDGVSHQWTGQLDYTRPLGSTAKLETGLKSTLRDYDNRTRGWLYDAGSDTFAPDPGRTHAFDFGEQVHAAYGVISRSIGRLELQGGLRAEQSRTRFELEGSAGAEENQRLALFPSAVAAFNVRQGTALRASYSKRVQRPDARLLNPFPFHEDPYNAQVGNPALGAEFTHAVELGYQRSGALGSLQVTPFFRHTVDAIRQTKTVSDEGVTVTSFGNYDTSDALGLDLSATFRRGAWSGFAGSNAQRVRTDGSRLLDGLVTETFAWSARGSLSWKVNDRFDAQGFMMYRAPMEVEQGRLEAMQMMHFAVRGKVGQKGALTLRVVDPFNQMRMGFHSSDSRHAQSTDRRIGARGVYLVYNYSFGRPPRIRQRPPSEQAEGLMPVGGAPLP